MVLFRGSKNDRSSIPRRFNPPTLLPSIPYPESLLISLPTPSLSMYFPPQNRISHKFTSSSHLILRRQPQTCEMWHGDMLKCDVLSTLKSEHMMPGLVRPLGNRPPRPYPIQPLGNAQGMVGGPRASPPIPYPSPARNNRF